MGDWTKLGAYVGVKNWEFRWYAECLDKGVLCSLSYLWISPHFFLCDACNYCIIIRLFSISVS